MSLDNLAIARVLAEIGDLLEIKSENPFKIRAYRNASETIAHTAERIADLSATDRLAIQGIGKDLNAKITELVETGTIAYHQGLLQEFPPTILDLLRLQGVGPKTVAMLYRDLKIGTLDDLERAAREGRLRGLKGMGAKKEAFILKSLEERARSTGRRLMAESHETAAALLSALREHAPNADISPVGSLRRGCETCGDLDILAAGAPQTLMDAFTGYKMVERTLAHGDTKSSVLLWGGFQADLRLVPRDSLGAALQYFTGSKPHNIALRDRAIKRGLKLNEYGLFRNDDGQAVAGASEEDIYRALDLAYIPPELRENRGEIEAAERGALPQLLTLADLRGDLHMHTTATDGRADAETMALAARAAGLSYIAITDHSQALAMANGLDERRALEHARRIRELNARLEGHHRPRRHRMRHPVRRHHGSRRRLPRRARHRHRLGALGVLAGRKPDDGSDPAGHRMPLRRRAGTSDGAADSQARGLSRKLRSADGSGGRRWRRRSRSTARSNGSMSTNITRGWRAIAG